MKINQPVLKGMSELKKTKTWAALKTWAASEETLRALAIALVRMGQPIKEDLWLEFSMETCALSMIKLFADSGNHGQIIALREFYNTVRKYEVFQNTG